MFGVKSAEEGFGFEICFPSAKVRGRPDAKPVVLSATLQPAAMRLAASTTGFGYRREIRPERPFANIFRAQLRTVRLKH